MTIKDKVIEKVTQEMMKLDNPLAQMIEEHLTEKCSNEVVAAKLLSGLEAGKTLKEISDQIWKKASEQKKGNCAFIPDAEVLEMVDEYFDIAEQKAAPQEKVDIMDLL